MQTQIYFFNFIGKIQAKIGKIQGNEADIRSVSARPEFLGVIDDPLFENLGVISRFRGSELFYAKYLFICLHMLPY